MLTECVFSLATALYSAKIEGLKKMIMNLMTILRLILPPWDTFFFLFGYCEFFLGYRRKQETKRFTIKHATRSHYYALTECVSSRAAEYGKIK